MARTDPILVSSIRNEDPTTSSLVEQQDEFFPFGQVPTSAVTLLAFAMGPFTAHDTVAVEAATTAAEVEVEDSGHNGGDEVSLSDSSAEHSSRSATMAPPPHIEEGENQGDSRPAFG